MTENIEESLAYVIVYESSYYYDDCFLKLERSVCQYIALGYKPQGGVRMGRTRDLDGDLQYTAAQAIVKGD